MEKLRLTKPSLARIRSICTKSASSVTANSGKRTEPERPLLWECWTAKPQEVRAMVVPNVKRDTLQNEILRNVKYGSTVYTDNAVAYDRLNWRYVHDVVNHAECYVKGRVSTNGLENFWSLLKRNLRGTYVAVEPFHLERYVDEQVFRYNNRGSKNCKSHRCRAV